MCYTPTMNPGRKRRLVINPEPLRLVPEEQRWMSGLKGITRETNRRVWIALGGDPVVWDEEHPEGE